ncbi:MAG: hypothetical protein MJ068_01670 [Clostridia bacterium]|nr:hypothetical protein [Clostridia bacterium]
MKNISINKILISVIMVLLAAVLIFSCADTVYAEETVDFTVIYTEGNNWTLKCGNDTIGSMTGSWVGNVDNEFSVIINEKREGKDFNISFVFPDDTEAYIADSAGTASALTEIEYTENDDSPLFFYVNNSGIIGGIWISGVEYKTSSDTVYTQQKDTQSLIRFGKNVPVGEYEVRAFVEEQFSYMEKECTITRYSPSTFNVEVGSNPNPPMKELNDADKTITYGESLNMVAERLSSYLGDYTPSEDGDYIPVVTDEKQSYKFNYVPKNPNYDSKEDVEIEFSVESKYIEIAIGNAQIICGEPCIDLSTYNLSYYVRTPLPAGDTESDLNLSFYFADSYGTELTNIDTSIPGEFLIKAKTGNKNYRAVSVNRQQNAFAGGRYFVFPTAVEYEIDGIKFTVNRIEGFERISPEFFRLDDSMREAVAGFDFTYDKDKKVIGNVYVLGFKEQSNYTYVKYDEEFFVTVSQAPDGEYPHISYLKDGLYTETGFYEDLQVVYENGTGGKYVYFVTLKDNIDYQSGFMWYHTLLIVLSSITAAGCVVMTVILIRKRWIL